MPKYERYPSNFCVGTINDLARGANYTAKIHGFWSDYDATDRIQFDKLVILSKLALIVSEVGEAVEAVRTGNAEELGEELADIIIRTLDMAHQLGYDVQSEVYSKMQYNITRPFKHGKAL